MSKLDTGIIQKQTAAEMVDAYIDACESIRKGYEIILASEEKLNRIFGQHNKYASFRLTPDRYYSKSKSIPEDMIDNIKRGIWYEIIKILELNKYVTEKKWKEINENIKNNDIPEITVANIYDLIETFVQNQEEMFTDLVKEAFETLYLDINYAYDENYVTNEKRLKGIGDKVILTNKVERSWLGSGKFEVHNYREQELTVVDKVFHILDRKTLPDSYQSPLIDAINTSKSGSGETEYFIFRAYDNGNLHLKFKRLDLLQALVYRAQNNQILA